MAAAVLTWLVALAVFAAIYAALRRRAGGTAPTVWPFVVAILVLSAIALAAGLLS